MADGTISKITKRSDITNELTYATGVSYQAGQAETFGDFAVISLCVHITRNITAGSTLITVPFVVDRTYYGSIISGSTVCACRLYGGTLVTEVALNTSASAYPIITLVAAIV